MFKPERLYKFLHARDLGRLKNDETLKVGSAVYYRRQYAALELKDPTINDPNEGVLIRHQQRPIGPWSSAQERSFFGLLSGKLPQNAYFKHNTVIMESADFHMLCFALGPLELVANALCNPDHRLAGIEPYDACLVIDDVAGFLHAVLQTGILLDKVGNEIGKLGEYWCRTEADAVVYGDIEVPMHEPTPLQDGFRKHSSFQHQQEYRVKFHRNPNAPILYEGEAFIVRIPGLATYLDEVEIPALLSNVLSG